MAGGVEHLDLVVPQADHIPLVIELQIVHLAGQGEQGTARPVGVSLVDIDIRLGIHPVEGWHRRGVVIVAVGKEEIPDLHPLLLQRLLNQLWLVAGIDDGGQVRLVVLQNIAVGADGPHPQQLYFHR